MDILKILLVYLSATMALSVQAAPTPMPRITGNAVAKVMTPVKESACRIPTAAEAL